MGSAASTRRLPKLEPATITKDNTRNSTQSTETADTGIAGTCSIDSSLDSSASHESIDNGTPHLPPANGVIAVTDEQQADWSYHHGDELEFLLGSGAIALINAHWLVALAKSGNRIERRQELPDEAFISLNELKAAGCPRKALPIIVVSHTWLHPDHPDPKCHNLKLLGTVLESYIAGDTGNQCFGVFVDFCSLHQKPRNKREDELFKKALPGVNALYAHQYTRVFRLTKFPHDYPEGYNLPEGIDVTEYIDRGWCFAETAWASMTKYGRKCIDLGKFTGTKTYWLDIVTECIEGGGRPAPLLPEEFTEKLHTKKFTNGCEDFKLVSKLYNDEFLSQFKRCTTLIYHNLGWGDDELLQLIKVIKLGALPQVSKLSLEGNNITDRGLASLEDAIGQGLLPALIELKIGSNLISDVGKQWFQDACIVRNIVCKVDAD